MKKYHLNIEAETESEPNGPIDAKISVEVNIPPAMLAEIFLDFCKKDETFSDVIMQVSKAVVQEKMRDLHDYLGDKIEELQELKHHKKG